MGEGRDEGRARGGVVPWGPVYKEQGRDAEAGKRECGDAVWSFWWIERLGVWACGLEAESACFGGVCSIYEYEMRLILHLHDPLLHMWGT